MGQLQAPSVKFPPVKRGGRVWRREKRHSVSKWLQRMMKHESLWYLGDSTRTKDVKRLKVYTKLLYKMSEHQAIAERPPTPQRQSITRFIRYEHLLAGVSGGVTSTLVLHPLDLIKIRFQGKRQWKTSYVLYGFVGFSFLYWKKKIRPAHGR